MVTFLRIARITGLVLAIAATSGVIAGASSRALDSRSSSAPAPSFAPFATDLHTIVLVAGGRRTVTHEGGAMASCGRWREFSD